MVGGLTFQQVFANNFGPPLNNGCAFGITDQGDLWGWGYNGVGQLGNNSTTTVSSPVLVVGGLKWQFVTGSGDVTFGITTSGALYAWGANTNGVLGVNSQTAAFSSPVLVVGGLTWASIRTDCNSGTFNGTLYTATGITSSGAAYQWGNNSNLAFGFPTATTAFSSPVLVVGGLTWASIIGNQSNTTGSAPGQASWFGITTSGALYAWGYNAQGSLGLGNTTSPVSSPTAVLGSLNCLQVLAADSNSNSGFATVCALTSTGQVYCWGYNGTGNCGQNSVSVASYSSPVLVVGGLTYQEIFGIGQTQNPSFWGLTIAGDLYGWGGNTLGVLGTGSFSAGVGVSSPTVVTGSIKWKTPNSQTILQVPVTPGTSYPIVFAYPNIGFGPYSIPFGQQLQIEYDG